MWQHLKIWAIRRLGGHPDFDSFVEWIVAKDAPERRQLLTLAVRRLYNTIGPEDILRESESGEWLLEGKPMQKHLRDQVVKEAEAFRESRLWEVLQADIRYQSNRRMFLLGKSETDMVVGKVWLYSLDAMATRLRSLAGGSGTFNNSK